MKIRATLLLAVFAVCATAADIYPVAGTVINTQTGAPLPKSRVFILRDGGTQVVATTITGEDGRFAFRLPEGKYGLHAGPRDLDENFGQRSTAVGYGTALITGPDQNTGNLVFRWHPPSAITGKITDDGGEPVQSALVQLIMSRVAGGRRIVSTIAWARSNDRGEYRFAPIPEGSYYLAVTATPWYTKAQVPGFDRASVEPRASVAYARAYYPNTSDTSGAAPLVVKPGEEAKADFMLTPTTGATITINHHAPHGTTGRVYLVTEGLGSGEGIQKNDAFNTYGTPEVTGVPPGHYLLRIEAQHGDEHLWAQQAVDVNGSDIAVDVNLRPPPTVSGTVALSSADAKPRRSLLVTLIAEPGGRSARTAARPDGTFLLPSVNVGKYRISIGGADGFYASDVRVDGAEYHNGVLDLIESETATVQITASGDTGRVKGYATQGDRNVDGILVVLAPAGALDDPLRYRSFQTDSDGSFDFEHIRAGDYLMFAADDVSLEYTSPAVAKPYLAGARTLHVAPHQTYDEKITATTPLRK